MSLYPFQTEAIKLLKEKNHLLVIQGTGSGKSKIYQTWIKEHQEKTLIISPLVALNQQIESQLNDLGILSHCMITSPESISLSQNSIKRFDPTFLVVDECHSIFEWGNRFRPALKIVLELKQILNLKRSLWLTATLPPKDKSLLLSHWPMHTYGKYSPSKTLFFRAFQISLEDRFSSLCDLYPEHKSGIIFVWSKTLAERIYNLFKSKKKCALFHSSFPLEIKKSILAKTKNKEIEIIIATSAFGMGIDISHFEVCFLFQPPPTLLSLAQTIGRVGRNSLPSFATVFWSQDDRAHLKWMLQTTEDRDSYLEVENLLQQQKCRLQALSEYFNQKASLSCGRCDFCSSASQVTSRDSEKHVLKI